MACFVWWSLWSLSFLSANSTASAMMRCMSSSIVSVVVETAKEKRVVVEGVVGEGLGDLNQEMFLTRDCGFLGS